MRNGEAVHAEHTTYVTHVYSQASIEHGSRTAGMSPMNTSTPPRATTASYVDVARALCCGRPSCPCCRTAVRHHGLTHCPAHHDEHPSLSIADRGRILVYCHAGCSQTAVLGALRSRGLWP
jgi:hypothetical protein